LSPQLTGQGLALLPQMPTTYAPATVDPDVGAELERWGIRPTALDPHLTFSVGDALRYDAEMVLVVGGGTRRLRRNGYDVERYRVQRGVEAGLVLVRVGTGAPPGAFGSSRSRAILRDVRHPRRPRSVAIAGRSGAVPGAVVAAGGGRCDAALLSDDPRRRTALLTNGPAGALVVKVPRAPDEDDRGGREQATLRRLHAAGLGSRLPVPLGDGRLGALSWSAESLAEGVPLSDALDRLPVDKGIALLTSLSDWLAELAASTARRASWAEGLPEEVLPLRGGAAGTRHLLPTLAGVPAATVHGDLASGANVLVSEPAFTVIDWETARPASLPLIDVVPLLCQGLARVRGHVGAASQAAFVLELCRGRSADSGWLFNQVENHAGRVGFPVDRAGSLATLAWAYQASMRLVHEELVRASGRVPVAWTSPAELIAGAWSADQELGSDWRAFARSRSGR
jgi:hypothetical protein